MHTQTSLIKSYNLLYIILFFLNISPTISYLHFTYPYAITLKSSGNIFIIHKTGVTICDPSYSTIIKNVTTFSASEEISDPNTLSKVAISQFDDGYIVSVIINNIYIFDIDGELKFTGSGIFTSCPNDIYYSLTAHKKDGRYYYYLLGFILNNLLYLQYYKYDSIERSNIIDKKKYEYQDKYYFDDGSYYQYEIANKGLSCLVMTYNSRDIITCTYYIERSSSYKYLSLAFFYLDDINNGYINEHYSWDNIKCIKSALGPYKSIALYCLYKASGDSNCIFFDYDVKQTVYYSTLPKKCINNYYSLKVNYYPETEEFAFSCLTTDGGIMFSFYNNLQINRM